MKTKSFISSMPALFGRFFLLLALAGAALAATGCSSTAGQKARQGVQETNSTLDGVDSATSTADRAADTANRAADTAKKVSDTLDRFFTSNPAKHRAGTTPRPNRQTRCSAAPRPATARFRGGGKNNFSPLPQTNPPEKNNPSNPHTHHENRTESQGVSLL